MILVISLYFFLKVELSLMSIFSGGSEKDFDRVGWSG